jgi:hypothetical protein
LPKSLRAGGPVGDARGQSRLVWGLGVSLARAADAVRRRWWVAMLGIVLTAAGGLLVQHAPGVYYQQVDVVFLWPQPPQNQENTFQYGSKTLIQTAGVVARAVGGREGATTASETATLVGQGIKHGWSVRLPNSGGQWAFDFEQPVLSIEAVGASPAEVTATTAVALARVNRELTALQAAEAVPRWLMIKTRMSPPTPLMQYGQGSRSRAVLMTLLVGTFLTLTSIRLVDRRLRRREAASATGPDVPTPDRAMAPA